MRARVFEEYKSHVNELQSSSLALKENYEKYRSLRSSCCLSPSHCLSNNSHTIFHLVDLFFCLRHKLYADAVANVNQTRQSVAASLASLQDKLSSIDG